MKRICDGLDRQGSPKMRKMDVTCKRIEETRKLMRELLEACGNSDIHTVKKCLNAGIDVNGYGWDSKPIHKAVINNDIGMVEYLLKRGANVNIGWCWNALSCAVDNGNFEMVEYLISQGASVNKGINRISKPIYLACKKGYFNIVHYLISHGLKINGWIFQSLMIAAEKKYWKIVNFVLLKTTHKIYAPIIMTDEYKKRAGDPPFEILDNGFDKLKEYFKKRNPILFVLYYHLVPILPWEVIEIICNSI